ncbi:hypothetical protein VP01_2816g1, partial [Puccinia sorghi]
LVPYPSIATPKNEEFNFIHSSTQMVVEWLFGCLKTRFQLLLTAQRAHPAHSTSQSGMHVIPRNL